MNFLCNDSSKLIGVLKNLNTNTLSTSLSNKNDNAAITFNAGITQLNSIVIQNIDITNAYLSSIGYTSPEYKLTKSSLYFWEVFLHQHLLSIHFLKHLNTEVINSSIKGNMMLKIIVMMMMEPMVMYQSEVMSWYWPWNKNSNYFGERSLR